MIARRRGLRCRFLERGEVALGACLMVVLSPAGGRCILGALAEVLLSPVRAGRLQA
jgi:hypothetical protein